MESLSSLEEGGLYNGLMVTEERAAETRRLLERVSIWAATGPVDPGTRSVVRDGFRVLHDSEGLLARLVEACR